MSKYLSSILQFTMLLTFFSRTKRDTGVQAHALANDAFSDRCRYRTFTVLCSMFLVQHDF